MTQGSTLSPLASDAPGGVGGPASRTVVLGLGNSIMADDGVGLAALERMRGLAFTPPVTLVDGGTWGLALLGDVEAADSLLILDGLDVGGEPGSLHTLHGDAIPRAFSAKLSPHQIDLRELLALATLRGTLPRRIALVGVQVAHVDLATEMSPQVAARVDDLVAAALDVLRVWGHQPTAAVSPHDLPLPPRPSGGSL